MTTRYVDGTDGNDAYNGLAAVWNGTNGPKKTLNGAEDTPVQAGDLVHVRSGTYRETLTCDVSGSAGSAIEYRGDYAGVIWSGGGVVRITGSDDDRTATRAYGITWSAQRNYRTFRGFAFDTVSFRPIGDGVGTLAGTNIIIEQCAFASGPSYSVYCAGANQANWTVRNCLFHGFGPCFGHSATVDNTSHVVENCIFVNAARVSDISLVFSRVGGVTVRNCLFCGCYYAIQVVVPAAGQTVTVNNCTFMSGRFGLTASANDGTVVENYNNFWLFDTPRSNVATGANSAAYSMLFDTRWFFEAVNGGSMVTPFDLASYSQLINVAGTSPTTTDMRGTAIQGAAREWGPLEYDSTLDIEAGSGGGGPVRILPIRGSVG